MVIGASWAGARSMTATAGPGISLMREFTGLAYYAETPAVIFDVQRVGPSTGPADAHRAGRPAAARRSSRTATPSTSCSFPRSVEECYTMAHGGVRPRRAVPDAGVRDDGPRPRHEQLDVGRRSSTRTKPINRGKLLTPEMLKKLGEWGRYKDVDGDGIPYRTVPGDGMPAYFTRGSGHNAKGQYSERPDDYVENMDRLARKFETARQVRAAARSSRRDPDAKIGFIGYGTSHWAIAESRDQLREETDVKTSYFRLRAYPFTDELGDVHRRARARLRRRAEPRRAAAAADAAGADAGAHARSCAACCTTTACRSTRAASPTTCWRRKGSRWRRRPREARRGHDGRRIELAASDRPARVTD